MRREMEDLKKNPTECLEMKNKISKIKIPLYRISIRLDTAEGKISELGNVAKIHPK